MQNSIVYVCVDILVCMRAFLCDCAYVVCVRGRAEGRGGGGRGGGGGEGEKGEREGGKEKRNGGRKGVVCVCV